MKRDIVFKEFVKSLSDEDVRYINFHLGERKSGDVGEIVEFFQQTPDVDRVLATAKDAWTLYDMVDEIQEYSGREWNRRSG